jgi:hypothetical protein
MKLVSRVTFALAELDGCAIWSGDDRQRALVRSRARNPRTIKAIESNLRSV